MMNASTKRAFKKLSSVTIALLLVLIIFPGSLSVKPQIAHAQFGVPQPVIETNPLVISGITTTALSSVTQTGILQVLNGIAWQAAKVTIQSLTRSTVNWINSGFNGSPAFVSDLNENLSNLSDAVADDFFKQLDLATIQTTGFNLTSPFQDQLNQQLRAEYYKSTSGLLGINQYDLNTKSSDPKAFLNNNFSKGGFNAFFSANGNPANNPFGAYELASKQLDAQISAAQKQRNTEYQAGKGFLPWRGSCTAAKTMSLSKTTTEACRNSPVRTPGSVIESQLELQLGSGVRQLELADSINEIVGALMGQLVNQVLGAGGLLGVSQPASGGGSSYLTQATSGSQYAASNSSLSQGFLQNIQNDTNNYQTTRDNWQKLLTVATAAQQRCGDNAEIDNAVTRATSGLSKANTSIQAIAAIQQEVQSAISSTAANQSTLLITATNDYQSFLASPTTPSAADIAAAASESIDTSGNPDGTQSTYSRMITLQVNCNA